MSKYTELQEHARRIVEGGASLVEVRLFGLHVNHRGFPTEDGEVILGDLALRLENAVTGDDQLAYVLVVETQIVEPTAEGGEPRVLAELEVAYGSRYVVNRTVGEPTAEEVRAFGFAVAAMALWPYLRATIARAASDMNLLFTALIPTITQAELAEAAGGIEAEESEAEPEE